MSARPIVTFLNRAARTTPIGGAQPCERTPADPASPGSIERLRIHTPNA